MTQSQDRTAKIWNSPTGECLPTLAEDRRNVWLPEFSCAGALGVTVLTAGTAKIWNSTAGECLSTLAGIGRDAWFVEFLFDGALIVTVFASSTSKIWKSMTGECLSTLAGYAGRVVSSAAFSSDGGLVLTASADRTSDDALVVTALPGGTAKIGDCMTGECLSTLDCRDEGTVLPAAFSPDDALLVTALPDGTAKIW